MIGQDTAFNYAHSKECETICDKDVVDATPEANKKRSETMQQKATSNVYVNSQAGSMWITNEESNKKIKKTDQIPEGWRKGRVSKVLE